MVVFEKDVMGIDGAKEYERKATRSVRITC